MPLTAPEKHQLKVARATLKSPDAVANLLALTTNAPSKVEAREIIKRLDSRNQPLKTKRKPSGAFGRRRGL